MNSIDLVTFAEHSRKIPDEVLAPISKKSSQTFRILASHLFDFWIGVCLTAAFGAIASQAFGSLMVTASLREAYSAEALGTFAFFFLPFILLSYFFFSYFMNHGQSWGMHLLKRRIMMADKSFGQAFLWAAHSVLVCLTGGLYYGFRRKIWSAYQSSDYLYSELLAHKEDHRISLIARIEARHEEREEIPVDNLRSAA